MFVKHFYIQLYLILTIALCGGREGAIYYSLFCRWEHEGTESLLRFMRPVSDRIISSYIMQGFLHYLATAGPIRTPADPPPAAFGLLVMQWGLHKRCCQDQEIPDSTYFNFGHWNSGFKIYLLAIKYQNAVPAIHNHIILDNNIDPFTHYHSFIQTGLCGIHCADAIKGSKVWSCSSRSSSKALGFEVGTDPGLTSRVGLRISHCIWDLGLSVKWENYYLIALLWGWNKTIMYIYKHIPGI